MAKRMLIDATHPEETRVVVMEGRKLESFDAEYASKKHLKGNIYLARIERVEPSLQAAFVDFGEERHGFLAFNEIHPDYFQIPVADKEELVALQREAEALREAREAEEEVAEADSDPSREDDASEDVAIEAHEVSEDDDDDREVDLDAEILEDGEGDAPSEEEETEPEMISEEPEIDEETQIHKRIRQLLSKYRIQEVIRQRQVVLVQVVKEERGNKGAALTTYISLAGRYCVLMPNALRNGGVSRKISSLADRRRLRDIVREQHLPPGMAMIVRTAGAQRTKAEITRDCSYLLQLWDNIRDLTFQSIAPALIYEEASLIKRAIRDVYTRDIDEIIVDGEAGWKATRSFMRMLMPHHTGKIHIWRKKTPSLFSHYHVEKLLDGMFSPLAPLRSGGYLVINQTEALVAVDVNSGKATHQRNVEQTALRTNREAAEEVARQMRLRDLAGLIVIDFIDMDNKRHNHIVENHLKNALRRDKARLQVGSISHFGLLEMSRQRLRPSVADTAFKICPKCHGTGMTRTPENAALHVLREIEEAAPRHRHTLMTVFAASDIAMFILNHKRGRLMQIEELYQVSLRFSPDPTVTTPDIRISYKRMDPALFPSKKKRTRQVEDKKRQPVEPYEETPAEVEPSEEEEKAAPRTRRRTKSRTSRNTKQRSSRRRVSEHEQETQPVQEAAVVDAEETAEDVKPAKPKRAQRKRSASKRRPGRPRKKAISSEAAESEAVADMPKEEQPAEAEVSAAPQERDEKNVEASEAPAAEAKPRTRRRRTRRQPRRTKTSPARKTAKTEDKASEEAPVAAKETSQDVETPPKASPDKQDEQAAPQDDSQRTAHIVQPVSVEDVPRQKRRKTGWWKR